MSLNDLFLNFQKTKKAPYYRALKMVGATGIEPVTPTV